MRTATYSQSFFVLVENLCHLVSPNNMDLHSVLIYSFLTKSLGITWCIVHANDRTDVCSASGESKSEEENEDDDTNIENCFMVN
jgi:hypothetical protein